MSDDQGRRRTYDCQRVRVSFNGRLVLSPHDRRVLGQAYVYAAFTRMPAPEGPRPSDNPWNRPVEDDGLPDDPG